MGIFRRPRHAAPVGTAIDEFWQWWPEVQSRIETALSGEMPDALLEEIAERVRAIHPDLDCELGQGVEREQSFTVTAAGTGALRGITERWRRAAPDVPGWEFHAARPARPAHLDESISLDDHELDLSHVQLGLRADAGTAKVHVVAYHPDFLFLPDEVQLTITNQVLDWALGEDDVARWIGEVTPAAAKPVDSLPTAALRPVVDEIADAYPEPAWLSGEGLTQRGHPARVDVRFPVHRQDYPLCELHVAVSVPYAHSDPQRLPVDPSAAALREFQDKLSSLGELAVYIAHETGDGRRVFHLYADPESGVLGVLDQLAAGWPEGRARVESEPDPEWEAMAPYRP